MRTAKADPPIRTKPASAGCAFRKFQTLSVSGGSKRKSLFDVIEDAFDHAVGTDRFRRAFCPQLGPFTAQTIQAEGDRDLQQPLEARPEQRGPDVRTIVRFRIGPNQTRLGLPKCAVVRHGVQVSFPASAKQAKASGGSVLISGARLCEPQHVVLQINLLWVTDPRSFFKLGHCPSGEWIDFTVRPS